MVLKSVYSGRDLRGRLVRINHIELFVAWKLIQNAPTKIHGPCSQNTTSQLSEAAKRKVNLPLSPLLRRRHRLFDYNLYLGKGYNQKAKMLFLNELFFEYNFHTVFLRIRVENIKSQRAALKLPYVMSANESQETRDSAFRIIQLTRVGRFSGLPQS